MQERLRGSSLLFRFQSPCQCLFSGHLLHFLIEHYLAPHAHSSIKFVKMWRYEDLFLLSPEDFEKLIADLWRAMGFTVTQVGGPGDQGVDVIATLDRGVRFKVFLQAKCYKPPNKVGVREIREYASLRLNHQVDAVIIVSLSGFTESALEEAKKLGVRTVDGFELVKLLNQYGLPAPNRPVISSVTAKGPNLSTPEEHPAPKPESTVSTTTIFKTYRRLGFIAFLVGVLLCIGSLSEGLSDAKSVIFFVLGTILSIVGILFYSTFRQHY